VLPQYETLSASALPATTQTRTIRAILATLILSIGTALHSANALTSAVGYDGPAALPRVLIQTAMANTPTLGITISVKSGENLQTVLNNARCGDTILLEAGATFAGQFTFPNKNCDDAHWIVVRTSSDNSLLPAQTSRITPCYAGVSSLPGRPAFNCTSTRNVLAKLIMNRGGGSGPLLFAPGANHYRLIGLELTRATGTGLVYALATPTSGGATSKIIYDRLWFHGTAQDDTIRGIQLAGSTYVSVINSFFTDFHCASNCTDSHAIAGGTGSHPMGPYKIKNNFLEAAGENMMFGGGAAAYTPADIEISHNHMFKPLTWLKGQPGYVGGANGSPFIVKNLLEFKNATRVLVEGNILEYTWGGFSQSGYAVLLTPKNQAGSGTTNLCPNCLVTDITIRYNTISHVGNGLQIANVLSDHLGGALDGERYSIHDLIIDDINPVKYKGTGHAVAMISVSGTAFLKNVSINHITAFPPSGAFSIGNTTSTKLPNFIIANSLITAGNYPVWSSGGGTANCAYYNHPLTTFSDCFSPYSFNRNAMIATPSAYPPSTWPSGNFFPATMSAVQFVNYSGRNYQLEPSSPYKGKGSDGKDLGADVSAINAAIAGAK
jgi:hypothetical protein